MPPKELKYTKTHEWARVEGNVATVGITDFAAEHLSDLVFIDLPDAGETARAGQSLGEVESVKTVADICSPVSGEIIEVNRELADNLERITSDAYGKGWMVKIRMSDSSEVNKLLDAAAYQKVTEAEE